MLKSCFTFLSASLLCASLGACQPKFDASDLDVVESGLNLADPRNNPTGRSTIEGRYVYAPPDEGEISFPLTLGFAMPGEYSIQEPSMVNGSARVKIKYSKKNNKVEVEAKFKGLPYRPSFTKSFDNSTALNHHDKTVTNASWQIWLIGGFYGRVHDDIYYDAQTLKFLGTKYDFQPYTTRPFPGAGTYIPSRAPFLQMICSPAFDGSPDPNGETNVKFTLRYDRMSDALGSPGTMNTTIPYDLCEPDHYDMYYTDARLPADKYMSFDYFLKSIWNGEQIGIAVSAEPTPRPSYLNFRDNTFIGWGNMYPALIPAGHSFDALSGGVVPMKGQSHQIPFFAPSRRHLCGGGQ